MPIPFTVIKVVSCRKEGLPAIEELSFRAVTQPGHQQLQDRMVQEVLGGPYKESAYPAKLNKPDLRVLGNASQVLVVRRTPAGALQSLIDAELMLVADDFHKYRALFFHLA